MKFEEIMHRLDQKGVMPEKVPSLKPTEEGLVRIGFFDSQFCQQILRDPHKSVIVAGTNGKGTVCATLERLLSSAGKSVGLYTSPHLIEATERIRLNGKDISKDEFCRHYTAVAEKLGNLQLTHFEWITLIGVHYWMETKPEYLILEVGMGGLWDSTNAVPHGTCVITRLGYDHEKFLGKTISEIARNKFGVIREFEGVGSQTVVHLPLPQECEALKKEIHVMSKWIPAPVLPFEVAGNGYPQWQIELDGRKYPLALPGKRAVENSSLALKVFESLGFSPREYVKELGNVDWPGRMERLAYQGKNVFLSGDHNAQGIDSLLEIIEHFQYQKLKILFGMSKDKNLEGMLPKLMNLPGAEIHLTESPFKGREISDFGQFQNAAQWSEKDPGRAIERLCDEASKDDLILVTGSLYLVGLVRGHIKQQRVNE